MMGLAAAVSLLSAPEPVRHWFEAADVLMTVVRPERPMFVAIRVTVSPAGRVWSCDVERSSGSARLDSHTCELTRRRARFRPARWVDGTPAWGVYRQPVRYVVTDRPRDFPASLPGDVVLRVNRLPKGVRVPEALVALAVDARGEIASCEALDGIQHARLVALGCDQLLKSFKARPARNERGTPVRSVQSAHISFVSELPRPSHRPPKRKTAASFDAAVLRSS